ncbi:MAG: exonuclease domain-containing protein [Candidatus Omnitrophota bacterium]
MRLDEARFTIFDVETTGLYPYSGDRICEIAAIKISPGRKAAARFHSLIDPERPISPGAFSVNGITDGMVMGKPTIEKVLPRFLKFIEGTVLVAYNAGFDLGFLESSLGEDRDVIRDYFVIDALRLARKLFNGLARYNLGYVSESLGIKVSREHRAMADATMAWKVFENELTLLSREGVEKVEEIAYVKTKIESPPVRKVKDYKLAVIEEAIRQQKKLNITYRSAWSNTVTMRVVTPKEIQKGYDKSYLVAHCHLKNAERNFRVDCITGLKVVK